MANHGCKGCFTPSLCINYPPNLDFFKKVLFCFFLPFRICLDKIKVGGDSCLTARFSNIKVSSPYYRTGDSAGEISIKRGYLKSLGFTLKCFLLFALFVLFFRGVLGKLKDESYSRIQEHLRLGVA